MKETRVAVVMNGGVSLSVWMGGVTHELNRLRLAVEDVEPADELERAVHRAWREILGGQSRVVVDTIAGTSAGGLNGTLLATAIARGADLTCLKKVWLDQAALEPDKLIRRNPHNATSLLDGDFFTDEINDALSTVSDEGAGMYPVQDVTLLVTATGIGSNLAPMLLEGGVKDSYSDSRRVFRFHRRTGHDGAELANDFMMPTRTVIDGVPHGALARAARASASFPAAFAPVMEDEELQGHRVPGSANVGRSNLMDGGVLDNAPFGPLVEALERRPVEALFDRVVLYVTPSVGARDVVQPGDDELLDIGSVLRAVASTVREPDQRLDVQLLKDAFEQMSYQHSTTHAILADALTQQTPDPKALADAAAALLDTYRKGRAEALHRWLVSVDRPVDLTRSRAIAVDPDDVAVIPAGCRPGEADPIRPGAPWAWGSSSAERVLRWLGRALVRMASDPMLGPTQDAHLRAAFAAVGRSQRMVSEVMAEMDEAVERAVRADDHSRTPLEHFNVVWGSYDARDPLGNAVADAARDIATWLSSKGHPCGADDVVATALSIEVISSVFAWGGGEGDVPSFTYLQVSPLARSLVEVSPLRTQPGQEGYDIQNRQWAAKKLYGERWGHFGAFATRRGREHDWLWGRLDGASALVHLMLGPDATNDQRTTTLVDAILAAEYSGDLRAPTPQELREQISLDAQRLTRLDKDDLYREMLAGPDGEMSRELLLAAVPEVLGETPLIAGRGEHFASLITQGVEGYLDFMEAKTSVTAMWHDLLRRAWQHLPWASKEDP